VLVYCAGVFDILHYGHVRYLEFCKRLGDVLVVGLVDDDGVARYKAHKPIMSYTERWEVVRALRCVDYVVRQNDTDPTATLTNLKNEHGWVFDVMVRGDDYDKTPQGTDFILANGGRVVRSPYTHSISSTDLKSRILKAYSV
jgi:rfaE bifunctional protein nucleotidyltransferase chain/domain